MLKRSILVTLTGPTASGKSHLLNFARDAGYSCLVSTTTRKPRPGEYEGIDYYFISDDESRALEAEDKFAELAVYNGARYGVTRDELKTKLSTGLTFLIVEPSGITDYVKAAVDLGAHHLALFVDTPVKVRIDRLKFRLIDEMQRSYVTQDSGPILKLFDRAILAFTDELKWIDYYHWDKVLSGTVKPEENLCVIMDMVARYATAKINKEKRMDDTFTVKIKNDHKTFWPDDIAEMYAKFGMTTAVQKLPLEMLSKYLDFRIKMLQEEVNEAKKALEEKDADGIVDAMIDISVFAIGTLDNFGIDAYQAWNEVHRANCTKETGVKPNRPNPFGLPDLIKPVGWTGPDHSDNVGLLPKALP